MAADHRHAIVGGLHVRSGRDDGVAAPRVVVAGDHAGTQVGRLALDLSDPGEAVEAPGVEVLPAVARTQRRRRVEPDADATGRVVQLIGVSQDITADAIKIQM